MPKGKKKKADRILFHSRGYRNVKLRYDKAFDETKTPRVAKLLDRLGAVLDEMWSIGVVARVRYERNR
jgi:hypothetical protein